MLSSTPSETADSYHADLCRFICRRPGLSPCGGQKCRRHLVAAGCVVRCKLACISSARTAGIRTRRMRVARQREFLWFLSISCIPHGIRSIRSIRGQIYSVSSVKSVELYFSLLATYTLLYIRARGQETPDLPLRSFSFTPHSFSFTPGSLSFIKSRDSRVRLLMLYNYRSSCCTAIAPHAVRSYDLMSYDMTTP